MDTTVVYYTCNREYPALEQAVRETILQHCGGMPIISVSHERLAFGMNLCVGQIEQSSEHAIMQLRIGAELAKTQFVAVCESDTLYPPQFFQFRPPRKDTYYYPQDGYITWEHKYHIYWRKLLCELTGLVARDHLLHVIDTWQTKLAISTQAQDAGVDVRPYLTPVVKQLGGIVRARMGPVVTLKTTRGMHVQSPYVRGGERRALPIWGSAVDLWNRYRCE